MSLLRNLSGHTQVLKQEPTRKGMGNLVRPVGIVAVFLSALLSGCIFSDEPKTQSDMDQTQYPSIWDRHTMEWDTSGSYSLLLEPGPHSALEVQEAFIDVDTSEVWETGPAQSTVHLSYWLPSNTLEGDKVPVIAVISPYFSYGTQGSESSPTNVVGAARGEFIFENFVPHGYAFAQVAVFGTEESSGCFDYRGLARAWAYTRLSSGWVPRTGAMVTWAYTASPTREPPNGRQRQWGAST